MIKAKIFILIITLFVSNTFARDYIIVQSTTSTANTGLLDLLSEEFFQDTGIEVRAVAVGTGTAIVNARKGDGDVLMVHSKVDELKFVQDGFGVERYDLMFNDFVILGPNNDPAKIKDKKNILEVMIVLSSPDYKFISRDDYSGTHKKELSLWQESGISIPTDSSYIKSGSGMASTINIANEMQAYVLTDRGTWIAFQNKNNLEEEHFAEHFHQDSYTMTYSKIFVNLMDMYDQKETSLKGFGRAILGLAADPTTYLGIGTFGAATAGARRL